MSLQCTGSPATETVNQVEKQPAPNKKKICSEIIHVSKPTDNIPTLSEKKIAVVDCFDGFKNETEKIQHGHKVAQVIISNFDAPQSSAVQKYDIECFDIGDEALNAGLFMKIFNHINDNADSYRAVNVSLAEYVDYDTLNKVLEFANNSNQDKKLLSEVDEKNLKEHIPEIKQAYIKSAEADKKPPQFTLAFGELVDKLSDKGVKVYIAAGNDGNSCNELTLFSKKAVVVGANNRDIKDYDGKIKDSIAVYQEEISDDPEMKLYFSLIYGGFSSNSRVDKYGVARYRPGLVKAQDGTLLVDVNCDGVGDFTKKIWEASGINNNDDKFFGTSFATPSILAESVIAEDKKTAPKGKIKTQPNLFEKMGPYKKPEGIIK